MSWICERVSDRNITSNNNENTSNNNISRKDFLKAIFWGGTGLALGGMGFFKIGNNNSNNKHVAFATTTQGSSGRGRFTSRKIP